MPSRTPFLFAILFLIFASGIHATEHHEVPSSVGQNLDAPLPDPPLSKRTAALGEETMEQDANGAALVTRDGAILNAILNNRALQIAHFSPKIAETFIPEERAAFDPRLMASLSYGRRVEELGGTSSFTFRGGSGASGGISVPPVGGTPAESFISGITLFRNILTRQSPQSALRSHNASGEISLSNPFPTGTTVFLTGGMRRQETNFFSEQYTGNWEFGVNQALLRGRGKAVNLIELKKAINNHAVSQFEFEEALLGLVSRVELAYWDLVQAVELLHIRLAAVELAGGQLRLNEDLFEAGRVVEGDVLSAKAEKSTRIAELEEARGNLRARVISLLRLMNPDNKPNWEMPLSPADPAEVNEILMEADISEALALQYRPELSQDKLILANRSLDVQKTQNEKLPRLNLSASYGRTSLGDSFGGGIRELPKDDYDSYNFGLTLDVPLLNRAEKARAERARLHEDRAHAVIADLEQALAAQVRQAIIEVEKQWQRISATQDAVTSRIEELRIEEDRYQAGRSTNLDLLNVQRLLIGAQVEEANTRVEYIKALTMLYTVEGTLLHRRGIALADAAYSE